MLTETPSWTSSDNKVHTDYLTGLKHALTLIFTKSGETDVVAKKIVDALDEKSIDEVVEYMTLIKREMGKPSKFVMNKVEREEASGSQFIGQVWYPEVPGTPNLEPKSPEGLTLGGLPKVPLTFVDSAVDQEADKVDQAA